MSDSNRHIDLWRIRETGVSNLGYLHLLEGTKTVHSLVSIEPTELFNLPEISCIKEGEYSVEHHVSPTFGKCLLVKDVEGRSHVLFHTGNFFENTKACILPGVYFGYANKDAQIDAIESKVALDKILAFVPAAGCKLTIKKVDNFQSVFGGQQ